MGEELETATAEGQSQNNASNPSTGTDEYYPSWPLLRFDIPPRRTFHFNRQFRTGDCQNNFLKGVKWSPDGSCLLTSSDDNTLRVFARPDDAYCDYMAAAEAPIHDEDSYDSSLIVNEAESVYDYCWYPYMFASDPTTCVFATTARDHPIHLWDALSGQLRCTYRAYDAMDEITSALSIAFNTSGTKLFAGYNKSFRVFDVHRPGRDFEHYPTLKGSDGFSGISLQTVFSEILYQTNFDFLPTAICQNSGHVLLCIVSSISFSPTQTKMLAMGSYSQTTAIYTEDNMELLSVLHGQVGGVTQVLFSKDGNYLYTGGRKDPYIFCWDIRNTAGILYKLYRSSESTNQRIAFDIDASGRHLGTGGQDGLVHIYDLQTGQWIASFQAASDTVNGFTFHPSLPLAASTSGQRRFSMLEYSEEEFILSGDENCASIWSFPCFTITENDPVCCNEDSSHHLESDLTLNQQDQ